MFEKRRKILIFTCIGLLIAIILLFVLSAAVLAKTIAGTTSRNGSKYDFNCVYTLTNDTANKRYELNAAAQLKIKTYKFSTTQAHKVNIKINGTTYTKTLDGVSGGNNSTTVTKTLYSKTVNYAYASAARSIPVSITTTDISSGGYGPGICKASTTVTIPAVTTTKTISGNVLWKDNDNQDGLRTPRTVTIKRDGVAYTTRTTAGVWSASVPIYKAAGGTSAYTVTGNALSGYSGPSVSGFNLTYTRAAFYTTTFSGTIYWEDGNDLLGRRPNNVTVYLQRGGAEIASQSVQPDAAGNWEYSFTGLPKNEKGSPVTYNVSCTVPLYETEYKEGDIINTSIPGFGVRLGFSI